MSILINKKCFASSQFGGGERYVKLTKCKQIKDNKNIIYIDLPLRNSNDVMELLLLSNAIDEFYGDEMRKEYFLGYIPYGRQDRICSEGESDSLRVFAQLLNMCNFRKIYTIDPHSDVSRAVINKLKVVNNHGLVLEALDDFTEVQEDVVLVCPDAGASKKFPSLMTAVTQKYPNMSKDFIACSKVRNPNGGRVDKVTINNGNVEGKYCVIVDDIIDGGRTFIELAKELRQAGALEVSLICTHGIFSKGFTELQTHLNSIYVTDTFCTPEFVKDVSDFVVLLDWRKFITTNVIEVIS